jgi:LysR family transcriptional regulator, nod-box dependent transcriptional activator
MERESLDEKKLSEKDFFAAGHVAVSIGSQNSVAFADKMLEKLEKMRRVEVVAPSFTMVPWLLQYTHRLALMHHRLAKIMAARFPIACVPMPFELPPLREMVQYHFARAKDEGLIWLRKQLHNIVGEESIL